MNIKHVFKIVSCAVVLLGIVRITSAGASQCDDPGLLPANHSEIARCDTVTNPNVSGKALISVEAADICVVRGREEVKGGDWARDRQDNYYIGGRIGYTDTATGQMIFVENLGQFWRNWADIFYPFSRSHIREIGAGIWFREAVSCGVLQFKKYRIYGGLDKRAKLFCYTFINCQGEVELDFELGCSAGE
jgi:hypothetical protein